MGRRRSSNKPPPKRKIIVPLDKVFNCPFCNHGRSCEVIMQRDNNIGYIKCTICLEDFQTKINYLSQEIDVYNDWIDACEEANA
ncbi:Transcription elongation factor 1 like [Schistosoma japonicum]|nr:SJCHGC04188 protein [Schistosoma japonicum]KAH8863546.1 Transcription elongation factor 1 like [Schistosoma japonicum]CAX73335.1 Transcription elongation factor 1 homolog [Schistosoma japonicum]